MSTQELIGQLRFMFLAAGSALAGRSLKSAGGKRRALRLRRRAVVTGPVLAPVEAGSRPRLRFAE